MTDREEEKLRKQIEQLRRLPGNRRCANCESLAVPYICLDFGTFVCTRCAAIHREFAHRAKSITASKFKPEEVSFMKGNAADAAYYLANWNEQLYRLPGAGNDENARARDFMHMKYEQKRWAQGEPEQQQESPAQGTPEFEGQPMQEPEQMQEQEEMEQPEQLEQMEEPEEMQQMEQPEELEPMQEPQLQEFQQFEQFPQPEQPEEVPQQVEQAAPARPAVEDPFADMFGSDQEQQPEQEMQAVEQKQPAYEPQPVQEEYQAQAGPAFTEPQEEFAEPQQEFVEAQPEFAPAPQEEFEPAVEEFEEEPTQFAEPSFQQAPFTSTSAKFNPAAFVQPEEETTEAKKGYDMFSDLVNQSANTTEGAATKEEKPTVSAQAPKPKPAGNDLLDF